MKLKKVLASILALVMVLSTMSFAVFAGETGVAKIVETEYTTFNEALEAASKMTGDVTVEIYDKVTLAQKLSGSYDSITFTGKADDAEIHLDVQGYITASGKTVNFEDLTLSKSKGGFITNAGFMNVAFGIYDVTEVNYDNCVFSNGAYASSGKVTFTECTFYRSHDKYGLWAYGNADITVDECTFSDYRGIKMYAEDQKKVTDLTVKSTDFSAVTDKPAIVLTYGESVTLEGNTYSSTGTFELDLDGDINGTAVTSDVAPTCVNDNGACGVLVDGKIYTTVSDAAEVATSGSTVTLLHNSTETVEFAAGVTVDTNNYEAPNVTTAPISLNGVSYSSLQAALNAVVKGNNTITLYADVEENVIVHQEEGINITIDGNDYAFDGVIDIYGHARNNGEETLTIKNVNFYTESETALDFITCNTTDSDKRYAHNVTIKNCTFDANTEADIVAMRFRQCFDINVVDCTFDNLHSAMWATGGKDFNLEELTVSDCKNGISVGTAENVVVSDSTINAVSEKGYGIRADGNGAYTLTVENSDITAYYPVIVRKATNSEYELTIEEGCEFTATNENGYDVVATSGNDDAALVAPENDINITIDETVDVNVFSSHVAKIGDTYYKTLEEAVAGAADGDVIDLLGNTFEITSTTTTKPMCTKNLTFQNGTMDFTYAVASNSLFDISANQTIKFKDMTLIIKDREDGSKMCYWMDLRASTAVAYFENCVIDFDTVQYSYISANGDGKAVFTDCEIEAEDNNFVYRASATFNNCTFDGFADLGEGEVAGNIIQWAAVPSVINNSTVYTRNLTTITSNGTISIENGSYVYAENVFDYYGMYYGTDNENYNTGLITVDATSTIEVLEADVALFNDASEGIINTEASSIYVQYKAVESEEGTAKYEIVLAGANNAAAKEKINELASADLKIDFIGKPVKDGAMAYTVTPAEGVSLTQLGDRYMFNYNGVAKWEESGTAIVIGTITIEGYGSYTLGTKAVDTNAVYATEIRDNIVDGFEDAATLVINRDLSADDNMFGNITDGVIAVPVRDLTIKVDFPNEVCNQIKAYQDMKVVISGGDLAENIEIELGSDATETAIVIDGKVDAKYAAAMVEGSYVINVTDALTLDNAYTVTVSGAGYRTARYTVTMTEDKALRFWNNVMDEDTVIENGKDSSVATVTYLAGDIVKDNNINIYDLSAVVSYFGQTNDTAAFSTYAKYDLNRDGVIDSKDVAYVLVSWDK